MDIGPLDTFKVVEDTNHISIISTRNHVPTAFAHIIGSAKDCGIFCRRYLAERQQGHDMMTGHKNALMGAVSILKP